MNYKVFTEQLSTLDLNKRQIINTINPHSYVTAKEDSKFQKALYASDILIPDGSGIVIAAKQLHNKKIKKIAGYDLHMHLLDKMNKKSGKVFYMGASEETLKKIEAKIARVYPDIQVKSYSPPYKDVFTEEENREIISSINSFKPDVLFIGMTAPKQEKWLYDNEGSIEFTIASSIGAVFDFYAEVVPRPSDIWIRLHLEWFVRLVAEPRRLWKRNFISAPKFLYEIFLYKIQYIKQNNLSRSLNENINYN
jgi:N-acetylglucosaminyldiphosphoundecaprenol N-acetyl-beta-D-mannosaminyltransferase